MCNIVNVAVMVVAIIVLCMIATKLLNKMCLAKQYGRFDSVELFDPQPLSLGVYNLRDIEPVILKAQ